MKGRRILVTGASGFVGRHLSRALLGRGALVSGLSRTGAALEPGVEPLRGDLSDPLSLAQLPRAWDGVVHLAGETVPSAFGSSAAVLEAVRAALHLLQHVGEGRIILVSSGLVYRAGAGLRSESEAVAPAGGYGLAKHLIEQLAPHFARRRDLLVARPFNHIGEGMRPGLVVPSLLARIAASSPGEPIRMAGQDSVRDFIDVLDVADAYLALLSLQAPRERTLNVCTGRATSIGHLARTALSLLGLSRELTFAAARLSDDDADHLVGDPSLLAKAGFTASRTLTDSLSTLLGAARPKGLAQ